MYIPDLFGAYVKGRELAVEKNWQDLKNFETIEDARNQNDLNAMDIWERRQQMPGKMSMFYNQAESSDMAMEVLRAAQRGRLARTNMNSDAAVGQYGVYKAYEPQYIQALGDTFGARIGQQANAAQNLLGQNEYLAPIARGLGHVIARTGANQVMANGVLGDNLVNAAQQGVNLSNLAYTNDYTAGQLRGKQLDSAIIQQPYVHDNTMYDLRNYIPTREDDSEQIAKGRAGVASLSEIASLISQAQEQGPNGGAAWHLRELGYDIHGNPLTGGQTATPAQTTPTTGQTQNSVPVGTNTVLAPTGTPQTNQSVQDVRPLLPPMLQNPNGGQVYNYPVSPEHGQYRPLVPRQNSVGATGGSGSVVVGGQVIYY